MGAPSQIVEPVPPMVSAFTRGWGFVDEGGAGGPPGSANFPNTNRFWYHSVYVPTTCIATRLWWANGSAVAGNVAACIYRDTGAGKPGSLVVASGSTAQSGTTSVQFVDIDTRLDPGLYWLAIGSDSTSGTILQSTIIAGTRALQGFQQSSITIGSPPNPATPVMFLVAPLFLFGFSTNTVT